MDYRTWTILNVVIIVVIIPVVSTSPLWMDPKMCDKCPAGTYMEVTCLPGQPDTATCTPCPERSFRRKPNHAKSCHPHKTSCDAPYQIKEPVQLGTRTHDAVCHCEHGTIKIHENKCVKRETCPPGKGSAKGGHCEHCKEGYFSDKLSKFQKCLPIRNCSREGKQTIIQGTRTSDALCGAIQTTRPQTWDSSKKNMTNMTKQQEKESTSLKPMERTEKLDANFSDTATVVLVTASTALALSNMTVHKKRNEEEIVHDKNIPIDFHEDEDNVTEYLKDSLTPIPHLPLGNAEVANTPVTTIDIPVRINVILGFTCAGLIATFVVLAIGLLGLRHMREIMKKITKENTDEISQLMLEGPDGHERDDNGVNSAFNEEIEEMPHLGPAPQHADTQEQSLQEESKEAETQPLSIQTAAVRPKQRSLPQTSLSEEDSLQYTGSGDDETVPLLLRDSQDVSLPRGPVFKSDHRGIEVVLHQTPPLPEDEESKPSMSEDATESVAQQTLPAEAEDLLDAEDQHTEGSVHDVSDAGPMSEPKELRTEKEDEEETSIKQISGSAEDTNDIPPDIEEIAREAALVRVPSDELSFPVQESTHDDSDGLEALGAVGGRSESPFSPLPSAQADSDSESSSGDEAYERKVRVAIRDSVAKSLFTGLAHHLSNPAGPGPDWVPLARAAGVTGPEIDHIINEAAQDLDKDIRKMLERYEEGKTGDRPISELYGELIARKRQELYNTFRRDPPS